MREFSDEAVEAVLRGYVECALWSSTGEDDEPLDDDFGPEDLAPATLSEMREDVQDFLQANAEDVREFLIVRARAGTSSDEADVGHDFWLTRNGHGAGFWDRGAGDVGDRLTAACRPYGEVWLYVGDGGLIYA